MAFFKFKPKEPISGVFVKNLTNTISGKSADRNNQLNVNQEIAIQKLKSILQRKADADREAEILGIAKAQVSLMDRSDRIRNFNFEQGRITCYKLNRKFKITDVFGRDGSEFLQQLAEGVGSAFIEFK